MERPKFILKASVMRKLMSKIHCYICLIPTFFTTVFNKNGNSKYTFCPGRLSVANKLSELM